MFKPGTNEEHVQMEDVLCDFCHRPWSLEIPLIEGHRGSAICARCLSVAYAEIDTDAPSVVHGEYFCRLSRENLEDRAALKREQEPGWRSPIDPEACISRMCIKLAAGALEKDPDYNWERPTRASS